MLKKVLKHDRSNSKFIKKNMSYKNFSCYAKILSYFVWWPYHVRQKKMSRQHLWMPSHTVYSELLWKQPIEILEFIDLRNLPTLPVFAYYDRNSVTPKSDYTSNIPTAKGMLKLHRTFNIFRRNNKIYDTWSSKLLQQWPFRDLLPYTFHFRKCLMRYHLLLGCVASRY